MKRMLAKLLVVVSALLLAVIAVDWIHSIFYSETLVLVRGPKVYAIDNFDGEVAFWRGEIKPGASYPAGWYHEHWPRRNAKATMQMSIDNLWGSEVSFAGFAITTQRHFPTTASQSLAQNLITRHVAVAVPLWFLTLLFGALPALAAYRFFRGRRWQGEGFCKVCGYDLRATPDRCPECGTPAVTGPPPQTAS